MVAAHGDNHSKQGGHPRHSRDTWSQMTRREWKESKVYAVQGDNEAALDFHQLKEQVDHLQTLRTHIDMEKALKGSNAAG